jgi:hypothetical protein
VCFLPFARETAGAARTRHSLRPLCEGSCWQSSDAFAPRDRGGVYFYAARPLRVGRRRSVTFVIASVAKQSSFRDCGTMDCFAALAMTEQVLARGCLKFASENPPPSSRTSEARCGTHNHQGVVCAGSHRPASPISSDTAYTSLRHRLPSFRGDAQHRAQTPICSACAKAQPRCALANCGMTPPCIFLPSPHPSLRAQRSNSAS